MKNYKITLQYDGTRYLGWEHQPGKDNTIQGKLEQVLARMMEYPEGKIPNIIGCGRTDAGVHADGFVCNVHLDTNMAPEEVQSYLNRYLPDDIGAWDVREASDRFHARYNAVGKTYRYTCWYGPAKPVFDRRYIHVLETKPDIEAMRKAASFLIGEHDFKSFCSVHTQALTTVRKVTDLEVTREGVSVYITVKGTGFLYNMVRIIAGTLIDVGRGRLAPEAVADILYSKDRTKNPSPTAKARGLTLVDIRFAELEDNNVSDR